MHILNKAKNAFILVFISCLTVAETEPGFTNSSQVLSGNALLTDSVTSIEKSRNTYNLNRVSLRTLHSELYGNVADYIHEVVVFGEDNRDTATGHGYGTLLCYDSNAGGAKDLLHIGTATVLDAGAGMKGDVITTAEHVLKDIASGEEYQCYFFPDRYLSDYMENRINIIHPVFGGYTETGNREHDWAVAIIDRKVSNIKANGNALKYRFDFNPEHIEESVTGNYDFGILSYDKDYRDIAISIDCNVFPNTHSPFTEKSPMLYVTDCDAKGGSSGGALLFATPSGVETIGIYIGSYASNELYPGTHYAEGLPNGTQFDLEHAVNIAVKYSGNKRLLEAIRSRVDLTW